MSVVVLSLVLLAVLLWPVGTVTRPVPGVQSPGASWTRALRRHGGRRGRRSQERLQADLAELVSLLAGPLRAGAVPGLAIESVAGAVAPGPELAPLLAELVETAPAGAGLSHTWLRHAERLDSPDLRFVARAWQLSERTGAPLAEALGSAERVLRARQRARDRVATAAAGPRSSMLVLAGLPCAGPVVGLAFGLTPTALYLSSPASMLSAAAGVGLGAGAWLWARRIVSAALRTGAGGEAGTSAGGGAGTSAGGGAGAGGGATRASAGRDAARAP